MKQLSKKEFLKLLQIIPTLGAEWVVTSTPEGCPEGYSKVYLRRKRIARAWKSLRVRLVMSKCMPNEEAEEFKKQIRAQLPTL